jgi:hypothetical protein
MRDKHQIIEERYEGKLSRTVLKTNGVGNNLVEFNGGRQYKEQLSFPGGCLPVFGCGGGLLKLILGDRICLSHFSCPVAGIAGCT